MPRKSKSLPVQCRYFLWNLRQRNGVWFADGRSAESDLGRHSLNTRDEDEARQALVDLDAVRAVAMGKAPPDTLAPPAATLLELEAGRTRYMAHVGRTPQLGGARPKTVQRYKAVFDKLFEWLKARGVAHWNGVDRQVLQEYVGRLDEQDYSSFTIYFEAVTVKQAVRYFIGVGLLPPTCRIDLKVLRPGTTTRYCWTEEEVVAMIGHCLADPRLAWLGNVLVALATTGLRIGELTNLTWADLDLGRGVLRLSDRRLSTVRSKRERARTTKGKRDRSFPIHPHLRAVLDTLRREPDGYVFRAACGGRLDDDKVRKALIKDVQAPLSARFLRRPDRDDDDDEPGFEDGTPHSFRHYFVVQSVHAGVNAQNIQDWLGHRDSKMVTWYYHQFSAQAQGEMEKLKDIAGGADAAWRRLLPPNINDGSTPRQDGQPEKT